MARLEFEFIGKDSGLSSNIKTYLQDIDKLKSAFSGISKGLGGNEVKTILDGQKIALGQVRLETAELTKAQKEYNLEQRKLRDTSKTSKGGTYSVLSRELTEMRNEAKNLGAQMILLENAGMKSSVVFNTLSNRFEEAQKQAVKLDGQIKKLDGSLGQYNRHVGNYERSQGNANGVAMEFNRIIQDAPFGMMGIGNNIQQLTANWGQYVQSTRQAAAETGKTVSTMSLVRGAMSSILAPANLLSLGIAAITSGWTMYTMWSQKAKKADEEKAKSQKSLKDTLNDYLNTLTGVNKSSLEGEQNAQRDLVRLSVLKKAYEDINISSKERANVVKELDELSKRYGVTLDIENGRIKNLSKDYDVLTTAILRTAKARAAEDMVVDNMKQILTLNNQRKKLYDDLIKKEKEYQRVQKATANVDTSYGGGAAIADARAKAYKDMMEARTAYFNSLRGMQGIEKENIELTKEIYENIELGGRASTTMADGLDKSAKKAKELKEEIKTIADYLKELQGISGVSDKDIASVGKVGLDRDIFGLQFDFDAIKNNIEEFKKRVRADKNLTEIEKLQIIARAELDVQFKEGVLNSNKDQLVKELQDRLTVEPVVTVKPMILLEEPKEQKSERGIRVKSDAQIINTAINSIFSNLRQNVDEFGLNMRSIFYTLSDVIGGVMEQLGQKIQSEFINKVIKDGWDSIAKEQKVAMGAMMAGQLISNATSPTNAVGQGLGGALSGAGTGFMIGGPIGAAIGGGLGLISGILGAGKRRKQEELQRQQLEEQKKANALLERMNALAYASQIIGSKTQYGIVTGVNRNEFGEITFRVQGQDLVASVDRTRNNNGR